MAGYNIYSKGPRNVIDDVVKEALLPGSIVKRDTTAGATFQQFTGVTGEPDSNEELFFLDKDRGVGQARDTAYEAGAVAKGFRMLSATGAQARVAAGTYTAGDKLTTAASARLAVTTTSGNTIVAYVENTKTISDADVTNNVNLIDVICTNRPTV